MAMKKSARAPMTPTAPQASTLYPTTSPGGEGDGRADHANIYIPAKRPRGPGWSPGGRDGPGGPAPADVQKWPGDTAMSGDCSGDK